MRLRYTLSMDDRKLLTVGPMARCFRVPVRWLKREALSGRIPHIDADGTLLFDPETVKAILIQRAKSGDIDVRR